MATLTPTGVKFSDGTSQNTAGLLKTGDTMTGDLSMAAGKVIKSSATGDDARSTGYKIADGTDIGYLNRSNRYVDDAANNCTGIIPTGNCSGNTTWVPPNGNWWTWGITGVPTTNCANYSAYDGGGGFTQSFNALTMSSINGSYTLLNDEIGGGEYHRTVANCNCGAFNCRTNCNCNCNCVCDCSK